MLRRLTQEEIANTTKSHMSSLESLNNTCVPNLSTLIKYAGALNVKINVELSDEQPKERL